MTESQFPLQPAFRVVKKTKTMKTKNVPSRLMSRLRSEGRRIGKQIRFYLFSCHILSLLALVALLPTTSGAVPNASFFTQLTWAQSQPHFSLPGTYSLGNMTTTLAALPEPSLTGNGAGTALINGNLESTIDYFYEVDGPQVGISVPMFITVSLGASASGPPTAAVESASARFVLQNSPNPNFQVYNILRQSSYNQPNNPNQTLSATLPFSLIEGVVGKVHLQIDITSIGGGVANAFVDPVIFIDPVWLSTHPGYSVIVSAGIGNRARPLFPSPTPGRTKT